VRGRGCLAILGSPFFGAVPARLRFVEARLVDPTRDDRAPLAIAASWAAVAITISSEMAVPGLLGLALDRWLGTEPIATVIGGVLGLVLGMVHLLKLTKPKPPGDGADRSGPS